MKEDTAEQVTENNFQIIIDASTYHLLSIIIKTDSRDLIFVRKTYNWISFPYVMYLKQ